MFLQEHVIVLCLGCEFPTRPPHVADDSMNVEPVDKCAICASTYAMIRSEYHSFEAPVQLVNDTSRRQCKRQS